MKKCGCCVVSRSERTVAITKGHVIKIIVYDEGGGIERTTCRLRVCVLRCEKNMHRFCDNFENTCDYHRFKGDLTEDNFYDE